MPRRKKYPRLPNAYGSIRYLGKNRTNPYAVHPPSEDTDERGNYLRPKAICYVDDWYVGFAVLNAYHAGTYKPGDEMLFKTYRALSDSDLDAFCGRILTDFSARQHLEVVKKEDNKTFSQVFEDFFEWKYGEKAPKKLSRSSRNSTKVAYKNCSLLHDRIYNELTLDDFQKCLDDCPLKEASIELIKLLLDQMGTYAEAYNIVEKKQTNALRMPDAEGDEHGVPFTDEELAVLWQHKENAVVEFILIMCYSGFRIAAYRSIEVNAEEWYFKGGVKNKCSKERMVPIHTLIRPLVVSRLARDGRLLGRMQDFRKSMYDVLNGIGITKHTPHDCRHTFSMLCERYCVNENDRKRMMGHSFGSDTTNRVYGHRSIEDLRAEIEKIQAPNL